MRKYEITYKNNDKKYSVMTFLDEVTEQDIIQAILDKLKVEHHPIVQKDIEIVSVYRR